MATAARRRYHSPDNKLKFERWWKNGRMGTNLVHVDRIAMRQFKLIVSVCIHELHVEHSKQILSSCEHLTCDGDPSG